MKNSFNAGRFGLAVLAIAAFSLLSVKWLFPPAAFIAPAILILLMQDLKPGKAFLAGLLILYLSGLIAGYKVVPFPLPVFLVIALIGAIKTLLPFLFHRIISTKYAGSLQSLIFPSLYVTYEYLNSFDGSGSWGSLAYTQLSNLAFMQLASVTGIWGIVFLITWGASLLAQIITQRSFYGQSKLTVTYLSIAGLVLLLGSIRIHPYWQSKKPAVRVAAISAQNLEPLAAMYEAEFGSRLNFDPETISQTSAELAELNKGFVAFVEKPHDPKFLETHRRLEEFHHALLKRASAEASAGAELIVFSEALFMTTKDEEAKLLAKGKQLAARDSVYLVLSLASIIPGTVTAGKPFLENKLLLIGPEGDLYTTFFKNKPVPLVEPSVPGDGQIPVAETPFGRLALSICYDADFPSHMRQVSAKDADLLLLPSGDWQEISPYHGLMASVRAIENGIPVVRPVSGARSIATNAYGEVIGTHEFNTSTMNVLVADLPTGRSITFYALAGDFFAWICAGFAIFSLGFAWRKKTKLAGPS